MLVISKETCRDKDENLTYKELLKRHLQNMHVDGKHFQAGILARDVNHFVFLAHIGLSVSLSRLTL